MQAVKKKKASASNWLKPVVVGQSQGSHLQATETNSDGVKQKRNLLKGYGVTHRTTEKAGETGSEKHKNQELRVTSKATGTIHHSSERVRGGHQCSCCPGLHAPRPALLPAALDTGYHHEHHRLGACTVVLFYKPHSWKDSPLSLFLCVSDFGFHLEQVHLIGQVLVVCPCPSCKGDWGREYLAVGTFS